MSVPGPSPDFLPWGRTSLPPDADIRPQNLSRLWRALGPHSSSCRRRVHEARGRAFYTITRSNRCTAVHVVGEGGREYEVRMYSRGNGGAASRGTRERRFRSAAHRIARAASRRFTPIDLQWLRNGRWCDSELRRTPGLNSVGNSP